ncbi:hypothetical protein [Nonomuraea fuscirosea]|uniref:hypothetical protein n=1 Tax=Nonomuraea fuscirosea TaxID=1291556 RepID=UPI0033EEAC9B
MREHAGRLASSLVSLLGDFSAAEEPVQDAVEVALRRRPVEGCRLSISVGRVRLYRRPESAVPVHRIVVITQRHG